MTSLVTSFQNLAVALDALEQQLDDKIGDLHSSRDALDQVQRQARAAAQSARAASSELAASIDELKAMIAADAASTERQEGADG